MHLLIDYGGTKFRYSFVNELNDTLSIKTLASKEIDFESFLNQNLDPSIESLRISFAGQVRDGVVLSSPNTNLKNFDIKKYIKQRGLQTRLYLQNDLNCAAQAVMHRYGYQNFVLLFLGTGFGAAFVSGGKVFEGENGLSLEIGHIPFQKTPFKCGCGKDSCVELSASGSAIKRWCNHFAIKLQYDGYDALQEVTDKQAHQVIYNFDKALEYAVQTTLTLFDCNRVILGGGVFESSAVLVEKVKEFARSTPFANLKNIEVMEVNLKESSLEGTRYL